MDFPRLLLVRQHFPDRSIREVRPAVLNELVSSPFSGRTKPGARVAIGVGSRGINNIATIVRAVVDFWKSKGARPFIFPAMGSHGAATAEGQADVLAHYGIIEATVGCPVVSSLDVVPVGRTPEGIEAFMDRNAFDSDGVMLVGRVKWHTDFAGNIESGLFKMMAIGLGKFAGAQRYHTYAYKLGLEHVIRSIGRQVLASGKILGGLAILEDANHNTAQVTAVPVEAMESREEELLRLVKSWMGRIPTDLDVLILDEIGKNISGAGMDTKVVNRGVYGQYNPWPDAPRIERIFIRGLSDLSYGNGVGLGMADVVSDRLLAKIDWNPTRINSLTASTPAAIRTPIHFPTDRECLKAIAPTVGKHDLKEVTYGWLRNSLELGLLAMSENLRPQIERDPNLEILGPPQPVEFDAAGNLADLLVPAGEEIGTAH
ncbi:MAG TPA: hypothetical protein VMT32_00065 [Bryobacteraceae bacterium]|nr:hypothetical protein [Bryobacteraceae bacterium]